MHQACSQTLSSINHYTTDTHTHAHTNDCPKSRKLNIKGCDISTDAAPKSEYERTLTRWQVELAMGFLYMRVIICL